MLCDAKENGDLRYSVCVYIKVPLYVFLSIFVVVELDLLMQE